MLQIACIGLHLATGLQHMHSLKLSHCDVKPENVALSESFVTEKGAAGEDVVTSQVTVMLIDLGSSARFKGACAELKKGHFGPSTEKYAAPETHGDAGVWDTEKSDVYALGTTLCLLRKSSLFVLCMVTDRQSTTS